MIVDCFPLSIGRNERGREMLNLVKNLLEITPTISGVYFPSSSLFRGSNFYSCRVCNIYKILFQGERRPFVMETVKADDNAKLGM